MKGPDLSSQPSNLARTFSQPEPSKNTSREPTPENVDRDAQASSDSPVAQTNHGVVMKKPEENVTSYVPDAKMINFYYQHSPETDKALASNIYLKTHYAKFVGFLIFTVVVACIVVIAVDSKNEYESMVLDETLKIDNCLKTYEENRCHPHQRVPALNDFCLELELCINADPRKVAKRSAAFSTLVAENANKLFGTLKLQTVVVICVLLFGSIISCNLFLTRDRKAGSYAQAFMENKHKNN